MIVEWRVWFWSFDHIEHIATMRAQATPSSFTATTLANKVMCVFTVHNPPETSLVQAGPIVAKEAQVQVELVLRTSDTLLEDTLNTPIDMGASVTAEARQTRTANATEYIIKPTGRRGRSLVAYYGGVDGEQSVPKEYRLSDHLTEDQGLVQRKVTLVLYNSQHHQILKHQYHQRTDDRGSGQRRVKVSVKCTDRDKGLVMHRIKDMDMFHLDRDFNVSETDDVFIAWRLRRSSTRHGRAQLVAEEPSCHGGAHLVVAGAQPYRVRWGYGLGRVWPWASTAMPHPMIESAGVAATLRPRPCGTRIRWS
ncbi:hypothetical protein Syun_003315 [Stephania yunnanensis]|uniref:Uncharacterized protein n=1 Tax=Stephania yunnanensis TaxID=152371 RepID=A0AAP0Q040_9MAGN